MKTVDVPVEGKVFFQDKISVVEAGTKTSNIYLVGSTGRRMP